MKNGDDTPKFIKAKGLCYFHYVGQKTDSKKTFLANPHSTSTKRRKSLRGPKNKQILDFREGNLEDMSLGDLKRVCDWWFRRYLISRAYRSGDKIWCPLFKMWMRESDIHVCHYIDRSHMVLRYSEDNCILCSKKSNMYEAQIKEEGFKSLHHKRMSEVIKNIEELEQRSKEIVIFDKNMYIELINKFKNFVNENSAS